MYEKIPQYLGLDVSRTVIEQRKIEWAGKPSRTFDVIDTITGPPKGLQVDMGMFLGGPCGWGFVRAKTLVPECLGLVISYVRVSADGRHSVRIH